MGPEPALRWTPNRPVFWKNVVPHPAVRHIYIYIERERERGWPHLGFLSYSVVRRLRYYLRLIAALIKPLILQCFLGKISVETIWGYCTSIFSRFGASLNLCLPEGRHWSPFRFLNMTVWGSLTVYSGFPMGCFANNTINKGIFGEGSAIFNLPVLALVREICVVTKEVKGARASSFFFIWGGVCWGLGLGFRVR